MSDQGPRVIGTVRENSTALVSGMQLQDENGSPVGSSSLTSITLTLYDKYTGEMLNNRNEQNILNANGVTIDTDGFISWLMDPADNRIVNAEGRPEDHVALFEWSWASGTKKGNAELILQVLAVENVP